MILIPQPLGHNPNTIQAQGYKSPSIQLEILFENKILFEGSVQGLLL